MKTDLTMKQIGEKIAELSKKGHIAYEEAGPDLDFTKVKVFGTMDTKAKVEKLQAINAELEDLNDDYQEMVKLQGNAALVAKSYQPGGAPEKKEEKVSLGELFMKSAAFKQKGIQDRIDIDLKTLFQSSAGWDPEATRIGRVELYPTRPIAVVDNIPMLTTNMDTIRYMKETTHTNNAAEAAAGAIYGEAALALTETSDEVEKIAVWLPCTDEQLADVPGIGNYLNQRLTYMLKARLDSQVLEGNGSTPNLWGAKNLSGVQSQAKGDDPTPDAIFKAFTLVRAVGFAEPSVIFIHPTDWQDIRLLRTADGIYIFGSPTDPGPDRIWGVRTAVTTACAVNTAITGDFSMYSTLFLKRGIEFKITDSHDTYFVYGKQAIRADMRCSMVFFRDTAFCKVTGI